VVLDPFAGCGTTLVASAGNGLHAIGYEAHPFFFRIASAKLRFHISSSRLENINAAILEGISARVVPENIISSAAWKFLRKLFDEAVLHALLGARIAIEERGLADDPVAFLILSRLVDECSHSQTDGIYKAPTSRKRAASPDRGLAYLMAEIGADVSTPQFPGSCTIHNNSSETMAEVGENEIDLIVTSPPYLNNFDYAEMTRMHLYFWGMAGSWGEITDLVRSALIVNTTTALKGHKHNQSEYEAEITGDVREEIIKISAQLADIKVTKAGRKDYDLLLRPYMAQVTRVYRECLRVLRPGARIDTMIADAAFYGVHVPSPQWLATTLEFLGFENVRCDLVRKRGHRWILSKRAGSPIGLGEYHISAMKPFS
jgi:hypothetical protein